MRKGKVVGLELEVLQYILDNSPITVREVAEEYGETHDLARTTILTIMERLRKKGYLTRKKQGGVFEYSPSIEKRDLMKSVVQEFFEKTMKGSLSPFVAYLGEKKDLSRKELKELEELVRDLKKGGK